MAAARDLCTIDDVVALVPGYAAEDDPDTDALLGALITEQSRDAHERAGREFVAIEASQPATRSFDITQDLIDHWAYGWPRYLTVGDISAAPTAVTVKDADGNTLSTVTVATLVMIPRVREDWQPYGAIWFRSDISGPISLAAGNVVTVTGTWGFPSVPDTVKDAVARLVILRYLNDVTATGTQFAEAVNRADLNLGAWWRQALDVIERFHVPYIA